MKLFILGPAGCGKSTFVKTFSTYLQDTSYDVRCVNLDPATKPIYRADADIRKYIRTEQVMKRYRLGINSALIKSVELSLSYIDNLKLSADYVLYDTPGQLELFIYSKNGRKFVEKLCSRLTAGVFLMDLSIMVDAESFLSTVMQNVIVSLRLNLPSVTIFSKSDIADCNIDNMIDEISRKNGALAGLLEKAVSFLEYTTIPQRIIKISTMEKAGFEDVFSIIHELFCACGDIS